MARLGRMLAAATVAAGLVATPATTSSAATRALAAKVRAVSGNDFRPASVTVPVGSVVGWVNRDDTEHTVTFGGQDLAVLDPGERARRRFREPGTYEYVCRFHFGMTGEVVVTD